jgi:hypothetical protein
LTATSSNGLYRLWALVSPVCTLVIIAGAYSAILDWRPGAFLAIGGLTALIGSRCTLAIIEYRRVMSRPWPKVPPLRDDDWD